jgi:hypothetical protein
MTAWRKQMDKLIKTILILGATIFCCNSLSAQVLEKVPDTRSKKVATDAAAEQTRVRGTTMSGSSGLVTMPTPDFAARSANISYKMNSSEGRYVQYKLEKDEEFVGIRGKVNENLELTIGQLSYERRSNPLATGLNFKEDHVSVGMKYSAPLDDKQMCMGFSFAPMSAKELNLADIEQLEALRNIYLTISETINDSLTGYMNLTSVFTKKQTIEYASGITREINRKDILIGALGLNYQFGDYTSLFGELRVGNYRDIFKEDSVRYRLHCGMRFGNDAFQLEVMGLNMTEDKPVLVFGGSIGF